MQANVSIYRTWTIKIGTKQNIASILYLQKCASCRGLQQPWKGLFLKGIQGLVKNLGWIDLHNSHLPTPSLATKQPRTNFGPKLQQLTLGFNRRCQVCVGGKRMNQVRPPEISEAKDIWKKSNKSHFSIIFRDYSKRKGLFFPGGYVSLRV